MRKQRRVKAIRLGILFQLLVISYLAFILVGLGSSPTTAYFLTESETVGVSISATSLFTVESGEEEQEAMMKDVVESKTDGAEKLPEDKEAQGNEIDEHIDLKEFRESNESTDSEVENEKDDSNEQVDE